MRILIAFLIVVMSAPQSLAAYEVKSLYGPQIEFDVLRNGDVVGEHITRFEQQGDDLVVTSRMNIDIFALFIPLYAFDYQSKEIWTGDQLAALDVKVRDGNDKTNVLVKRNATRLDVDLGDKAYQIEGSLITTNHWNAAVVKKDRVLNTLTGNVNEVRVINQGPETIDVVGGQLNATRYDYTGDLKDTSVWYDAEGRWVKLRFKARDGSTIDYRCRTCLVGEQS